MFSENSYDCILSYTIHFPKWYIFLNLKTNILIYYTAYRSWVLISPFGNQGIILPEGWDGQSSVAGMVVLLFTEISRKALLGLWSSGQGFVTLQEI